MEALVLALAICLSGQQPSDPANKYTGGTVDLRAQAEQSCRYSKEGMFSKSIVIRCKCKK